MYPRSKEDQLTAFAHSCTSTSILDRDPGVETPEREEDYTHARAGEKQMMGISHPPRLKGLHAVCIALSDFYAACIVLM